MKKEEEVKILEQIPDTWMDEISDEEFSQAISKASMDLLVRAAQSMNLDIMDEQVLEKLAEAQKMSMEEFQEDMSTRCFSMAQAEMFYKYYGDVLPKNEEGDIFLTPAIIAKMSGEDEAMIEEQLNNEL
jgi:hypothetical protein